MTSCSTTLFLTHGGFVLLSYLPLITSQLPSLLTTYHYYLLATSLLTTYYLPLITSQLPSLPTTYHYYLLTTYYLLLTTYF